ncbi:hypothetical protein ElyMa_002964100 [Elysia marginata]|uniref:Uncharacterized protein n=1 Tax=Elysia marginata TaxID=1093978 RepID=A0AAV4I7W2_9GAST|nr:hypothetical protein ElyMa_002964100 [Elysia marginata]
MVSGEMCLDVRTVRRWTRRSREEQVTKKQEESMSAKKKVKQEQDLKHKYKKMVQSLADEKEACLHLLNSEAMEEEITLKQKVNKCIMYADNVRLLYMTLQGEANVAASQASKVVMLVAKYLFDKEIPQHDLPRPRICLNFMYEANHIAKQHIVNEIRNANHFTYATDGTGREKRHYMEHHIVLDSGSTLSVGFSEVADDKADALLEKTLDIFEELTDVYCQADKTVERKTVFTEVLTKLKALMSDRAANMKLFNRKMLDYKKIFLEMTQ